MAEIVLSILIPTTKSREIVFNKLLKGLREQIVNYPVEIVIDEDEEACVGSKRNHLLAKATGEWVVFVDSDDHVSNDYVSKLLEGLKNNPDCLGISGWITTNGKNKKYWHISKDYGSWYEKNKIYYRTTNHITAVRKTLAIQAGFPEKQYGEDFDYSMRLLPLLKTETKVKGLLYHYDYRSK